MRKAACAILAALVLVLLGAAPASADRGWNHGGHGGHGGYGHGGYGYGGHGGYRGYGGYGHHGYGHYGYWRGGFHVGVPLWWGLGAVWGPSWWGPSYPAYPAYPAYAGPPAVAQRQAPVYVQQEPQYWYYCQSPQGYHPYVQHCPGGWLTVVPPAGPPGR